MSSKQENNLNIPIPQYPPFKLRSSLIDKDPVIWVHLLEAYINLFKYLVNPENSSLTLTVQTQQQLKIFLKSFLQETADESTKIFSLGTINPDIKTNTAILRILVFQYIKSYSIVKSNLTGESVWNFVKIYVKNNTTTVRGLVDGTFKSKYNDNKKSANISSIQLIHKHLENLIINSEFDSQNLIILSYLLGQHTNSVNRAIKYNINEGPSSKGTPKINKKQALSSNFAEKFVETQWIESLERLYADGSSIHCKVIENVMLVSLISVSIAKISKLTLELGITSAKLLSVFPLFGTIIISDAYKVLIPGLEERLPFLRTISFDTEMESEPPIDENHIQTLMDLFPQLSRSKARRILQDNNHNIERVTDILLEDPSLINSIPEAEDNKLRESITEKDTENSTSSVNNFNRFSSQEISSELLIQERKIENEFSPAIGDLKKKTLTAALRLMYESDEDEPDDTYDENEKTEGKVENGQRNETSTREPQIAATVDKNEQYLFSIYKTKGDGKFSKMDRKSSDRKNIKSATGWSDEQIEGWLRMLMKSSRRFKILENDFLYSGNPNRNIRPKALTPEPSIESKVRSSQSGEKSKNAKAKDEKNKASRANHNRKTGYDKKSALNTLGM